MKNFDIKTFQWLILTLQNYWADQGCSIFQPIDIEVGAATAHPVTFLRAIGPEPISIAYVQPTRRPNDGRYANNVYRLQHYYQFQVIIKPPPKKFQDLYFNSLRAIGLDLNVHDICFIEDNWEHPTLGACGMGWEVRLNNMEITQFTYFQQVGGLECQPITGEITYGLERISLYLQNVNSIYDLIWSKNDSTYLTYGDFFYQNEIEQCYYNFNYADVNLLLTLFEKYEKEIKILLSSKKSIVLVAYEKLLKIAHIFNLLDSRKYISITERQDYILRIRSLSQLIAKSYYNSRKKLGFPMCNKKKL